MLRRLSPRPWGPNSTASASTSTIGRSPTVPGAASMRGSPAPGRPRRSRPWCRCTRRRTLAASGTAWCTTATSASRTGARSGARTSRTGVASSRAAVAAPRRSARGAPPRRRRRTLNCRHGCPSSIATSCTGTGRTLGAPRRSASAASKRIEDARRDSPVWLRPSARCRISPGASPRPASAHPPPGCRSSSPPWRWSGGGASRRPGRAH
mmetsp:Transcript_97010/g.279176  ORF Transcript_97010/g.279176 Transcript_97010/m.279176 type:complete len:209 (-) Transcript_97010:99-725(-)